MADACSPEWFLEGWPDGNVPSSIRDLCRELVNRARVGEQTMAEANPLVSLRSGIDFTGGITTRRTSGPAISTPFMPSPDPTSSPMGGGNGGGGGGVPDWICALAGMGSGCSATDLISAGAGHLIDSLIGSDEAPAPDLPEFTPGDFSAPQNGGDPCPGGSIRVAGICVAPGDAFPGGDPFITTAGAQPVRGLYGAGFTPTMESRQVRTCPPGFVLGKDNVCYDHLPRSKRKWDPGMKPLLTGGDRAAIRKAATAARKLKRAKKQLKKSARALEKVS